MKESHFVFILFIVVVGNFPGMAVKKYTSVDAVLKQSIFFQMLEQR